MFNYTALGLLAWTLFSVVYAVITLASRRLMQKSPWLRAFDNVALLPALLIALPLGKLYAWLDDRRLRRRR